MIHAVTYGPYGGQVISFGSEGQTRVEVSVIILRKKINHNKKLKNNN